jgi:glycosyltransferase involved in cell wall biosynthesis
MIVKNEEDVLARCLESAKFFVDEIVIVDTGSTDKTKQIARQFTDKVYDFEWVNDFSLARNFSFSKATKDFILWLDADDVVEGKKENFLALKASLCKETGAVMMRYNISFDNKNRPIFSYYRERIVKNDGRSLWRDPEHEFLVLNGKVQYSPLSISHRKIHSTPTNRNLKIYQKLIRDKKEFSPRQKFYYSRELMYNGFYRRAIKSFNEFLAGHNGWLENNIEACANLSFCYQELNDKDNSLLSLFRSFAFDKPRAEILCKIGDEFFADGKYTLAIHWYEEATKCVVDLKSGAFVLADYYKYIPYLQLCVCYSRLNDFDLAEKFNSLALEEKPYSKEALHNKNFFKNRKR